MYALDFEYDGKSLSDYGFIVCEFGESAGVQTSEKGSEISFTMTPVRNGKSYRSTGSKYDKCLSTSFQICKNQELFDKDELEISNDEFRSLARWLNRREFLWFHSFDWDEPEKEKPWFRASFTLTRIDIGKKCFGIELAMETDAPFGYGEEIKEELSFTASALSNTLIDRNDEIGETYPELTIVCGQAGTLTLSDDVTGCESTIKNCMSGETLSFSGDSMILSTDNVTHANTIANDYNYDFFRIGNTFRNRENIITASAPCTVELRYRPIWKDTL